MTRKQLLATSSLAAIPAIGLMVALIIAVLNGLGGASFSLPMWILFGITLVGAIIAFAMPVAIPFLIPADAKVTKATPDTAELDTLESPDDSESFDDDSDDGVEEFEDDDAVEVAADVSDDFEDDYNAAETEVAGMGDAADSNDDLDDDNDFEIGDDFDDEFDDFDDDEDFV